MKLFRKFYLSFPFRLGGEDLVTRGGSGGPGGERK